jgi:hypothetical protein
VTGIGPVAGDLASRDQAQGPALGEVAGALSERERDRQRDKLLLPRGAGRTSSPPKTTPTTPTALTGGGPASEPGSGMANATAIIAVPNGPRWFTLRANVAGGDNLTDTVCRWYVDGQRFSDTAFDETGNTHTTLHWWANEETLTVAGTYLVAGDGDGGGAITVDGWWE